jgi:hypothetical protein
VIPKDNHSPRSIKKLNGLTRPGINASRSDFGPHYCAVEMPKRNDEFLAIIKEFGFGWFEKFKPAE